MTSLFFNLFYLVPFYHVKTHLSMIMMKFKIVIVENIVILKNLTTFDLFFLLRSKYMI
jgi:hypothetical protein